MYLALACFVLRRFLASKPNWASMAHPAGTVAAAACLTQPCRQTHPIVAENSSERVKPCSTRREEKTKRKTKKTGRNMNETNFVRPGHSCADPSCLFHRRCFPSSFFLAGGRQQHGAAAVRAVLLPVVGVPLRRDEAGLYELRSDPHPRAAGALHVCSTRDRCGHFFIPVGVRTSTDNRMRGSPACRTRRGETSGSEGCASFCFLVRESWSYVTGLSDWLCVKLRRNARPLMRL